MGLLFGLLVNLSYLYCYPLLGSSAAYLFLDPPDLPQGSQQYYFVATASSLLLRVDSIQVEGLRKIVAAIFKCRDFYGKDHCSFLAAVYLSVECLSVECLSAVHLFAVHLFAVYL